MCARVVGSNDAVVYTTPAGVPLRLGGAERRAVCGLISQQRQAFNFGVAVCLEAVKKSGKVPSKFDGWKLLTDARRSGAMPAGVPVGIQRPCVALGRDAVKKWNEARVSHDNRVAYWTARLALARSDRRCKPEALYWESKLAQRPTERRFADNARYWRGVVDRVEAAAKKRGVRHSDRKKVKPADAKSASGAQAPTAHKRRPVDLAAEESHCRARLDRAIQKRDRHRVKGTRRLFRALKSQRADPGGLPALAVIEGARLETGAVVLPGGTRLRLMKPWAVPDGCEWTGAVQIADATARATAKTRPQHRRFTMRAQLQMAVPESVEPSCADEVVGIDAGVAVTVAVSDGRMLDLPDEEAINAQIADAKRGRARCDYGSRQWRRRSQAIRGLYSRRNHRRDEATRHIAKQVATTSGIKAVGAEITNTVAMTASAAGTADHPGTNVAQKRGLNRSLADRRFGGVRRATECACVKAGVLYVGVAAAGTSLICHRCGTQGQRETQALFRRASEQGCGWEGNADHNAANTVKHRAWSAIRLGRQNRRSGGSSLDGGPEGNSEQREPTTALPSPSSKNACDQPAGHSRI